MVSLKAEDGMLKCNDYLKVLDTNINKEYKAFLIIKGYIEHHQSISYWIPVRDEKQEKIAHLVAMKQKITTAMQTFEGNVFDKVKAYMIYLTKPELRKYIRMLRPVQRMTPEQYKQLNTRTKKAVDLLTAQVATIETIKNCTGYDVLNS